MAGTRRRWEGTRKSMAAARLVWLVPLLLGASLGAQESPAPAASVRARVQMCPGGPVKDVDMHPQAMTAWAENEKDKLLPGILAYEWGWRRFHPDTEVFRTGER